jgi:hypothetical protein
MRLAETLAKSDPEPIDEPLDDTFGETLDESLLEPHDKPLEPL